jgi:UDP-glucose 4-epimerase
MNVFLTGSRGFFGKNIKEQLSTKYVIVAPSHKELELVDTAAVDHFFKTHKVDVVIHCAVKPGHRNAEDLRNQLYVDSLMFYNLVRNAGRFQKMIYLSSGAVYDIRFSMVKVPEDYYDTHVPTDEHGLFRYITSKYVQHAENILELRPFSVFGKYEDYAIRFISNAICKTLFDLPITMKQNRRFDFIYIDDLVRIIEYFIVHDGKHKFYNSTPDEAVELKVLAEKVKAIAGKDLPILIGKGGMGLEYSGSNKRLREEIKGLKFTPIEEAIEKLYKWYFENKSSLNKGLLLVDK